MTTEERQLVRRGLIHAGYERCDFTNDNGYGVYQEVWRHSRDKQNFVTIDWDVKTPREPRGRER